MNDPKEMKILIVDDMPNMVRTIKNMLRHLGYRHTAEAGDGLAAWKVLQNDAVDFAYTFESSNGVYITTYSPLHN